MKNRILVAIIGLPLLYLIVLNRWAEHLLFALAVSAFCTVAALEVARMLRRLGPWIPATIVPIGVAPLFAWQLGEAGLVLALFSALPLLLAFNGLKHERRDSLVSISATISPVLWIAPAAALIVILRQAEAGFDLVILLIASVFANDTGAYFIGRAFGKHKLSPRISPNKSIEGFLGGVSIGTFVMWYGHFLVESPIGENVLNGWEALGIGVAVALAVPAGDLFESLIKRSASIKDSSRILGEHGGALDRIDALLFAIPVMYIGCFYAGAL